jgi:hypothetical protein
MSSQLSPTAASRKSYSTDAIPRDKSHAIVIGGIIGGMAGLPSARVLADHFDRVLARVILKAIAERVRKAKNEIIEAETPPRLRERAFPSKFRIPKREGACESKKIRMRLFVE